VLNAWPYGALYVLEAVWKRLGIPDVISEQLASRHVDFAVERALFAMVANRACAPGSKLYCYEQWLREDVRLDGTDTLALHHLYRAMDVLEAHKEAIAHALYVRLADVLNLDVELIFYDTTSLHFEIDEMDQGHGEDDLVEGSLAAGSKTYKAPRKTGPGEKWPLGCPSDRDRACGDPRWLAGAALGFSWSYGGCQHHGPGEGRSARVETEPLCLCGRCRDGITGQP